ncbi:AMP-binding protein [Paracoccus sp. pheM1]|uniref:AMP-binding protein n=1 Tax=Paracoccus sp. pheM1 TaxID=2831675 RepID=UPI001BDB8949|nr:AMP-binding protein [Paracoccus sp. pheM1]MBT0782997.1 AMP-binding protein [Paracoccus sp. pheM1]
MTKFDLGVHRRKLREQGHWTDEHYDDFLRRALQDHPDKLAVVGDRASGVVRLTFRELEDRVARAAGGLRKLGVGKGDVVALQMPNWWEFVVAVLATQRLGAITNPLMPIFRERELRFMLGFARCKVFIVPEGYGSLDLVGTARQLRDELDHLEHVVVANGSGSDSFEALLNSGERVDLPPDGSKPITDPGETSMLMYTSGTTGSPKGVQHTANSMVNAARSMTKRGHLSNDDVFLVGSPVGHMLGLAAGVVLAIFNRATMVLQESWNGRHALELIEEYRVTFSGGATPFLADLVREVQGGAPRPETLRLFLCAGAPIPPVLVRQANEVLGTTVTSVWGMTESLASTMTEPERAGQLSSISDGRPVAGMQVKVVDDAGRTLAAGERGRLLVRGAQLHIGYMGIPPEETFDAEGWMDTGDLAYCLAEDDCTDYIRIAGRTKDVIIRGGENIPVVEIENLLVEHPAITIAALVGYPDQRLGERACAFLTVENGATVSLDDLRVWMDEKKVAKQYWPERIEIIEAMPRTPSGKIQKFLLRDMLKP